MVIFLKGMWVKCFKVQYCQEFGIVMVNLYLVGVDYFLICCNVFDVYGWWLLFDQCSGRSDMVFFGLEVEIVQELEYLEFCWLGDLLIGVIYVDLFLDNVFFFGDILFGLIDFYFVCNDVLVYDFVICFNVWCFENDFFFNVIKVCVLLSGYIVV